MPEARFLVVGGDLFGDHPDYEVELHRLVSELGLEGRTLFTGYREDARALIAALNMLVLPSENEPFGRVMLEAMACAKPVVAFDRGGPREIIVEGETGFLVPPERIDAMADAVVNLLQDPALADRLGAGGQRRLRDCFSGRKCASETEAIYEELLPPR